MYICNTHAIYFIEIYKEININYNKNLKYISSYKKIIIIFSIYFRF